MSKLTEDEWIRGMDLTEGGADVLAGSQPPAGFAGALEKTLAYTVLCDEHKRYALAGAKNHGVECWICKGIRLSVELDQAKLELANTKDRARAIQEQLDDSEADTRRRIREAVEKACRRMSDEQFTKLGARTIPGHTALSMREAFDMEMHDRLAEQYPEKKEPPSLLEAARVAYEAMSGNNNPFDPRFWSDAVDGLSAAIARAEQKQAGNG